MPDMLVSLMHLPPLKPVIEKLRAENILVRRPNPWDIAPLREFITKHFSAGWADETAIAFTHQPVTAFIAEEEDKIIGFGAYECTRRDFFGPTGVDETYRKRGVGKAILLACLHSMQDLGYVYAIIGAAGPVDYYAKTVGARVIEIDDGKGCYPLKEDPKLICL
jgi:predicted N-acetyltransferase YhbS